MAKIKCKYCGKKIDDGLKRCSKCNKELIFDKKRIYKLYANILWILVQIFLSILIYIYSKDAMYSGVISDLYVLMALVGIVFLNCIILGCSIFQKKMKKKIKLLLCVFILYFVLFGIIFSYKIGRAYYYENSSEIRMLSEKYQRSIASNIRDEVNSIFEYDKDGIFERNVIISNFYTDNGLASLYLNDFYGNYTLKFYLVMDDFKIRDVFWMFNDEKLYLVSDGQRTENFEYYYAMYIVDSVLGEDVKGLAKIEDEIEKQVKNKLKSSSNIIFNYDELEFDSFYNTFKISGDAFGMNFYDDIQEKNFLIQFDKREKQSSKHVWYYGEPSFDYVDFDVNS